MNLGLSEIALLGIILFGFVILVHMVHTARRIKHTLRPIDARRPRRLISAEPAATQLAEGLIDDLVKKNKELAKKAREEKKIPQTLEKAIEEVYLFFRERVEHKHCKVFHQVVRSRFIDIQNKDKN